MPVRVTRVATTGQELAGGGSLDATYSGTDVDVTTGLPLDGLLDVNAPAPGAGDVLTWDDGAGEWIAAPSGGGATIGATVEDETTWGISPDAGISTDASAADHTHGSPANPVSAAAVETLGFVGQLLISDTPSTPLVFADLIQTEAQDDLVYADL